jgi:hypothetical protein
MERGHCHGCNRYTRQDFRETGSNSGFLCRDCGFFNSSVHECDEEGTFLTCRDCGDLRVSGRARFGRRLEGV